MGWGRALRAAGTAVALVVVVAFAAANFVLVDVRLWSFDVHTRLAWAVVVPAALSFAAARRREQHHNVGS